MWGEREREREKLERKYNEFEYTCPKNLSMFILPFSFLASTKCACSKSAHQRAQI